MITEIKKPSLKESDLWQFTGTETYYRHCIKPYFYTEGIQFLAEKANAHWLIGKIFSLQAVKQIKNDEMLQQIQFWRLKVNEDNTALLTCERDENDITYTEKILYTEFPLSKILLYLQNNVLHLPSEY